MSQARADSSADVIPLDVQVTRLVSLKNETLPPPVIAAGADSGIFCDWIGIYQNHGPGLPLVNDGAVVKYDSDGALEFMTLRKAQIKGSHESSVFVRCDGSTVWFDGNVSKFGRPDNVFGLTFDQCIDRINFLLATLGLPPFTAGRAGALQRRDGSIENFYTGARLTRLDVTQNFGAGSKSQASDFMRWLSSQQASRMKTGTHGEGETVDFGRGSRYVYSKAYLKGPELLKHSRKVLSADRPGTRVHDEYIENLAAWCDAVGLVRFESTYKSTFLIQHNIQYLGGLNMNVLHADFSKRKEVFTRANVNQDELTDLPPKLLGVYRMWASGDDLASKLSRPTFYRHRAALLPFGVDISVRSNVRHFQPRVRVITLGPVTPPSFYQHPTIALAA